MSSIQKKRSLGAGGVLVAAAGVCAPFGCTLAQEGAPAAGGHDRAGTGSGNGGTPAGGTAGSTATAGKAGAGAGGGGAGSAGMNSGGSVNGGAGATAGIGGGTGGLPLGGNGGDGAPAGTTGAGTGGVAGMSGAGSSGSAGSAGTDCGALTTCGDACVSTLDDNAHCGGCDRPCAADRACANGMCACVTGTDCSGACVDTSADAANCGECGNACREGELCSIPEGETRARCVTQCANDQTRCGQSCVDLATSHEHCGGCDMPCPSAQVCENRGCACPDDLIACGDQCVNTMTSAQHCGGCNAPCAAPRSCNGGQCRCQGTQSFCGGACVDTQTNNQHCGSCDHPCTGSATCSGGMCQTPSTTCDIGPTHAGDGSFTYYYFGQGTGRDGGGYRTACGYYGTENGTTDTVENIANTSSASNTYFAAIPGDGSFSSSVYCGACVEITGQNGTKIIATVIDNCPTSSNEPCRQRPNQHLDLSKAAFDRLGYSVGNPTNTTWRFVACPVSGNVKVRFKTGNDNEFFVENGITAIASVSVNGTTATRTTYGAWHVGSRITTPATLELVDKAGRSLSVTLNAGTQNQDTGRQFPNCN